MPRDREIKLILRGDSSRLNSTLNKAGSKIKGFASGITRGMGKMISGPSGIIGGLGAGYGIYRAGKSALNFQHRLYRLGAQLRKEGQSAEEAKSKVEELKTTLHDTAKETHQSQDDLLSGIEAIVQRTGDFDFAVRSLRTMGIVATASGASMEDIGATVANLAEKMNINPKELLAVFDVLATQGKSGAFTLQDMANQFERLLSSASRIGVTGVEGIRRFGAFLQVARRGAGSPEQATTAVERVIANVISKASVLEKEVPEIVFEVDENGVEKFRNIDEILKSIVEKSSQLGTKKQQAALQKIFGDEGIRAISNLVKIYEESGGFDELDKFIKLGGKGTEIMEDFKLIAESGATKAKDVLTRLNEILDKIFSEERIKTFGEILDKLNAVLDDISKKGLKNFLMGAYQEIYPKVTDVKHPAFALPIEAGGLITPAFKPWWTQIANYLTEGYKPSDLLKLSPATEHLINLVINIDQERGQVITKSSDKNTKAQTTLKTGKHL